MDPREELDSFLALVSCPEWKTFLNFKEKRAEVLQKEVNRLLSEDKLNDAIRAQARLDENSKDIKLLRKRMDELTGRSPKEEEFT